MKSVSGLCVLLLSLLSAAAHGEIYAYLSEGETGEPAFSDIPSDDAQRITLPEFNMPALSSAEQIDLMLRVADELAVARAERATARAEYRRQKNARTRQPVNPVYVRERPVYYGYPYRHRPHRPVKPHPKPEYPPYPGWRPNRSAKMVLDK